MENLEIFEIAIKYFLGQMTDFKNLLVRKINKLDSTDWVHNKGSIKTCKADEAGRKMRCKVGLKYGLKVELSLNEAELIWEAFQKFFKESYFEKIERNRNNEELGRYEFIARTSKGDEIECSIYLANEWNIPQFSISGFVSSRFKSCDFSQ
ncbi:hypothetical protein [Streptococcus oralis]|uniref:hypothetical protein n=1 Tax=Streptococcus oralis TaxID=1303 RepID=UPI0005F23CC4|nr:hypothetical protein [Streptococcus oralis]KJQ77012.1 hypothetical protein TZ95_00859 [Streptococcus oralis subsp. tigurinus]MCY7112326.1 hypothetical protein [Streptococcus oralis]